MTRVLVDDELLVETGITVVVPDNKLFVVILVVVDGKLL